jgi:LPXTG-site transpeptidase (sortase) family protein
LLARTKQLKLKLTLIIVSISGIALFSAAIFFLTLRDLPAQVPDIRPPASLNREIPQQIISALPVHIKIPSINVDAAIEHVGLTSDGSMAVPKGPSNTAWYDLGTRPGDIGSAVISGHYGWKNNIPAAFDNLHKLAQGDKIYVEGDDGKTITFIVREYRIYDQNADASDVFDSRDGASHLNLITCEGVWNSVQKSYSGRLVVFADKQV